MKSYLLFKQRVRDENNEVRELVHECYRCLYSEVDQFIVEPCKTCTSEDNAIRQDMFKPKK